MAQIPVAKIEFKVDAEAVECFDEMCVHKLKKRGNILKRFQCKLLGHEWTCHVEEHGRDHMPKMIKLISQIDTGCAFAFYARSYCKRCGVTMDNSQTMINKELVRYFKKEGLEYERT